MSRNEVCLGRCDRYISDTQWEINDGLRYGIHPLRDRGLRSEAEWLLSIYRGVLGKRYAAPSE